MAFFPPSPANGDYANVGNITYQWSAGTGAWNRVGTTINPLIDGTTVNITGNILSTGDGVQSFAGTINTSKSVTASLQISAVGNITGANLVTSGSVSAIGNINGAQLTVVGVNTGTVAASGAMTAASLSTTGSVLSAASADHQAGNLIAVNLVQGTTLSATGNATVAGNVTTGGAITAPGNISGGNLVTLGSVYATANLSAIGNVAGSYFLGNGALLSGISTGVSLGSRSNVTITTSTLANAASYTGSFTGYKGYALYKIATSAASWVRVYTSAAAQSADASRNQFTDPQPGAGVIAEAITNGANVVLMSPASMGFNDEASPSNTIPITVTNLSGSTQTVDVTFTILQLEV